MFNPLEVQNGPASRDMRYKIQKWNVNSEKVHPILVANARVDWMSLDDSDITQQFEILREGILRDVFSQRTSSAWQGMQPQRLTVSLLLPGMGSKADEWLNFLQRQRQFWPTMTTRHASLAPMGHPALTGTSWTRSCTAPNRLGTPGNFYGRTSLSRSTAKILFRSVSIRVMIQRMFTTSGTLTSAT